MAKTRKEVSFVQAAIPLQRGVAKHVEHIDDRAYTTFDKSSGEVKEIHTPPNALKRVHEVMHARHTRPMDYPGVRQEIYDIVEDCRLHMKHWPWGPHETPQVILEEAIATIDAEIKSLPKLKKKVDSVEAFNDFACRLRATAVCEGLLASRRTHQPTESKIRLEYEVVNLIRGNNTMAAAAMLETVFFGDEEGEEDGEVSAEDEEKEDSFKVVDRKYPGMRKKIKKEGPKILQAELAKLHKSGHTPRMNIVELPLEEQIKHTSDGFRLATSGSRIYRPALRRPILPQRIFWRRSPDLPAGAVLFDASGSMGVSQDVLLDCCCRAPTATIAYYAGSGHNVGTLWVFAQNGMRARKITEFPGDNSVDGLALDWLMQQDGPKMFVTDRGFCSSNDSTVQLARLEHLENLGEVKVYTSYSAFKAAFPIQEAA